MLKECLKNQSFRLYLNFNEILKLETDASDVEI